MTAVLDDIAVDRELIEGARNAVRVCLRVQPHEKVTLIADEACRPIGASLLHEVRATGAACRAFMLEDFSPRPHTDMPEAVLNDLATSQVSIYAAVGQQGELRTRMQMTAVVNEKKIRHAHMINVTRQIMMEGMRADYGAVDELSTRVIELARAAKSIRATTPRGTDVTAEFTPSLKWLKTSGIITPEKWGNLPGGEIFTCPLRVEGTFVVDGVVGDYLCAKYGDLEETPLTIRIRDTRMTEVHCDNRELEQEFWNYCHTDANSDRVGEFAIGTNTRLTHVIGNILQDEKIPGVHIAFGHPYAEHTGADWKSSTHIDVVGTRFDIHIDGRPIMRAGSFLL